MKSNLKKALVAAALVGIVALPSGAFAGTIKVAVAANFQNAMQQLIPAYNATSGGAGTTIQATYDSSGNFDAAIRANNANAPGYALFLSADDTRTPKLVTDGFGTSNRKYAQGQLAVYSLTKDFTGMTTAQVTAWLKTVDFTSGAVANPTLAPYGVAAQEYLTKIGLWPSAKIDATYSSIGNAFNAANGGGKQVGFVANSQTKGSVSGKSAVIDAANYSAIDQAGCLLKIGGTSGTINSEASDFWTWMATPAAKTIIKAWGYNI